jgi:hypothetical protein
VIISSAHDGALFAVSRTAAMAYDSIGKASTAALYIKQLLLSSFAAGRKDTLQNMICQYIE